MGRKGTKRVVDFPEMNVVVFSFFLNFIWEMYQVELFAGMAEKNHWAAVLFCTRSTLGDVAVSLVSYWIVSLVSHSGRNWLLRPGVWEVAGFSGIGVLFTTVAEIVSTRVLDRWSYSDAMPVIPILEVGLVPVLQWVILPPLIVWFVNRQLSCETHGP